ncbi:unnamed protein product [Symbiodinium necroappetens]|uniref:Uncharacterized protein n=1 Tax=Symbiodinium necroappetens TaxID=1628268 RepID=A0A812VU87_9DINO|nr:unnamed protein product [Symbiodinium necroappetens]
MGGALEALLAQDDVEPDETGSHSMASDHYPAVKSGSRASSASGASPHSRAYPRAQAFASTDAIMPPPPPPAPPRHASDPRLHMSDQNLETEHHIERDAIGGAMSVKLVTWSEPLKITANHTDVVERNARYLGRLYHEAKVKEPPVMEWTFLANVMQAYTGNKETLFSHVVCMESKQHLFWIHCLREPFSTKAGDSAVHRHTLHFGHGTNTAGVEGIMDSCYLAPATIADGAGAVGHYSQASPWGDSESLKQVFDRVVQSGKWQCPVMVHGFVMTPSGHHVMESGGGAEAQQACMIHAAVHFKRDKKWLLHSDLTTVTSFVIAVKKQFQPLRDHLGRPIFQLGPTHADTVKQQVVSNKFTRDLQIDGMDIFDIRLAQVMTGGQDPYLWDNRYTAIKELAKATEGPVRSLEDFWNARPTDAVPEFERTTQARFLEECKLDNYKVNTINNWVSQKVGKDKMAQVYRSNLNAPWVGVMLSKLRLHEKKFAVFGTKAGQTVDTACFQLSCFHANLD